MNEPAGHRFLIADPFLRDENFIRTVVYLCSHNESEGSFGLVLNRPSEYTLNQLMTGLEEKPIPVFLGGPVGLDTIHFLHCYRNIIPDSLPLSEELSWGGDFETVKELMLNGQIEMNRIKFFIGYSGWNPGQLQAEIDEKTWLLSPASQQIIFDVAADNVWKESLRNMGGDYEQLIHYPIDPTLN